MTAEEKFNQDIGILIPTDKKLRDSLIEMASRVDDYYYLPFWFELRDGKIYAHHFNSLPKGFKKTIELMRNPVTS